MASSKPDQPDQAQHESFQLIKAPSREDIKKGNKSIFFSGSIKWSMTTDWQKELAESLSHLPVTIFDPRRPDWDDSWVEDIQDLRFRNQVEWELDHMKAADLVITYFASGGLSAVSMLEFGLCVGKLENGRGTMIVCCEPGFARTGNVQVICARHGIPLLDSLEDVPDIVKHSLDL